MRPASTSVMKFTMKVYEYILIQMLDERVRSGESLLN